MRDAKSFTPLLGFDAKEQSRNATLPGRKPGKYASPQGLAWKPQVSTSRRRTRLPRRSCSAGWLLNAKPQVQQPPDRRCGQPHPQVTAWNRAHLGKAAKPAQQASYLTIGHFLLTPLERRSLRV